MSSEPKSGLLQSPRVVFLLLLALLLLGGALATLPSTHAIECCVDLNTGLCTEGVDVPCDPALSQEIHTDIVCSALDACQDVCCCANDGVPNADEYNLIEENLRITQAACDILRTGGDYSAEELQESCVEVCSGTSGGTGGTTGGTVSVQGEVSDETGATVEDAAVYIPYPYGALQDTTDQNGDYTITDIPKGMTGQVIASKEGCLPGSSGTKTFNDDATNVNLQINCNPQACELSAPTVESVEAQQHDDGAIITLSHDDPCLNFEYYIVIRTKEEGSAGGMTFDQVQVDEFTDDSGLEPNTEYCYSVAGYYGDKGIFPSAEEDWNKECFTTGDAECMHLAEQGMTELPEWCDNTEEGSELHSCDEENHLIVDTCTDGEICALTGQGSDARYACVEMPACANCNGIFGILKNIVFSLFYGGTSHECDEPAMQQFCFPDRTLTTVDAYRSCGEITTCESYLGADACAANPCGIPDTCAWNEIIPELGRGVCRSTSGTAECGVCEELFGACNKELCEAIGAPTGSAGSSGVSDCYYDEYDNGLDYNAWGDASRCLNKDEMACRFYDTQEDCIAATGSGGNADVDADYDSSGARVGGTNALTTPSSDRFNIQYCAWQSKDTYDGGGFCYKDANGWTESSPDDDCIENGRFAQEGYSCLLDAEAPTTELIVPSEVLGTHELILLNYIVSDNHYSADEIQTRFCIENIEAGGSGSCYPETDLVGAIADLEEMEIGETATFAIRYYSYDPAGNLEPIQSKTVTLVEQGYPRLEDVYVW